eukprot:scaffold210067_cov26-Tisochrysis_lutea.AAC.2
MSPRGDDVTTHPGQRLPASDEARASEDPFGHLRRELKRRAIVAVCTAATSCSRRDSQIVWQSGYINAGGGCNLNRRILLNKLCVGRVDKFRHTASGPIESVEVPIECGGDEEPSSGRQVVIRTFAHNSRRTVHAKKTAESVDVFESANMRTCCESRRIPPTMAQAFSMAWERGKAGQRSFKVFAHRL